MPAPGSKAEIRMNGLRSCCRTAPLAEIFRASQMLVPAQPPTGFRPLPGTQDAAGRGTMIRPVGHLAPHPGKAGGDTQVPPVRGPVASPGTTRTVYKVAARRIGSSCRFCRSGERRRTLRPHTREARFGRRADASTRNRAWFATRCSRCSCGPGRPPGTRPSPSRPAPATTRRDMAQGTTVEAPEREIVLRCHQLITAPQLTRIAYRPHPNRAQIPVILFHGPDHIQGSFACSGPNGGKSTKKVPASLKFNHNLQNTTFAVSWLGPISH